MGTPLPNDITLTYNGIQFPASTEVQISASPVYDSANRTVVRVNYTLSAKAILSVATSGLNGNDIGDDVIELRKGLTKAGGKLVYKDAGFGDLEVNVTNADCVWGPKPRVLSWKPKGVKEACEVTWQVEFALAECEPASSGIPLGSIRPPMEFCYRIAWSIDQSGYTRRTYAGHVAIAQTRNGVTNRSLADSADRLREQINPKIPTRFKRSSQEYSLSEDKCRLDFTIVDEQCTPNILPAGVISCRARHSVETANLAMLTWTGTISASYEMSYLHQRSESMLHFMDLLQDRIDKTRQDLINQRNAAQAGFLGTLFGGISTSGVVIPTRFSMEEPDIYGRESASYSMSYRMTLSQWALTSALEAFGLFRPSPKQDWSTWNMSLTTPGNNGVGAPLGPRGSAGLKYKNDEDKIIDLCLSLGSPTPLGGNNTGVAPPLFQKPVRNVSPFQGEIAPVNSWLEYFNRLEVEQQDNTAEARLLPTSAVVITGSGDGMTSSSGGYKVPYSGTGLNNLVQVLGRPSMAVSLKGRALRAGYGISPPQITGVGGEDAVPANRRGIEYFRSAIVGNAPYPICAAEWCLRWIIPNVPSGKLVAPASPTMGNTQQAQSPQLQFAQSSSK